MYIKLLLMLLTLTITHTTFTCHGKTTYQIGFMLDNQSDETDALLVALEEEIKAVVGEDASIEFPAEQVLVNDYDLSKAKTHYQQLLSANIDLIIAFGVVTNEVITKQKTHQKPTILFGTINPDDSALDTSRKTSGIKNFTYLITSASYKQDLIRLKELTNYSHVGVVVDAQVVDFLDVQETFAQVTSDLNTDFSIIPLKTVDDVISQLSSVDAVYMAGGFFLTAQEVRFLADELIKRNIPSFTLNSIDQVENGLLASQQAEGDIGQFFRRIALTVESYVNGTELAQMPVFVDTTSQLTINYNTAEAIGVPIKYSLLANTDFVGDFQNSLAEASYDLIDWVNLVLEKNLDLQATELNIGLQEKSLASSKSAYLPSVQTVVNGQYVDPELAAISSGSNPEFSTAGSLVLNQTLFSTAANADIAIQRDLLKAQKEQFNASQLDRIYDAISAYFNVLILKTNAQTQLLNLSLTKDNLQLAELSYEVGQSSKTDALRFKSAKAQNTQAVVEAGNQLERAYISLNQLINNPTNADIEIKDVRLDQGVFENYNYDVLFEFLDDPELREVFIEFMIMKAKDNAPELKALAHNISAAETEINLNGRRRFIPTIDLQGQYNKTFDRSGAGSSPPMGGAFLDDNYTVGLRFTIPLFQSNQFNINRQRAILRQEQLEITKQDTALSIDVGIRAVVLQLVNQMSNIQLSEVSEQAAEESLALTTTAYNNGAVNIVQLIDAQNNYINSQLAKSNAIYNFLLNALQLERSMGRYFFLNSQADNDAFKAEFFNYLNNENNQNLRQNFRHNLNQRNP